MSRRTLSRWCLNAAYAAVRLVVGLLCFFAGAVVFCVTYHQLTLPR